MRGCDDAVGPFHATNKTFNSVLPLPHSISNLRAHNSANNASKTSPKLRIQYSAFRFRRWKNGDKRQTTNDKTKPNHRPTVSHCLSLSVTVSHCQPQSDQETASQQPASQPAADSEAVGADCETVRQWDNGTMSNAVDSVV